MSYAEFGRMKIGRCVTKNFGHVGCSTGVLPQVDAKCSGRHACTFSVSDPALVRTKPCPQDFSSYLEASYECLKGKTCLLKEMLYENAVKVQKDNQSKETG